MSHRAFEPVHIILPDTGGDRRVASAFEALECLLDGWPILTSSAYRRAVRLCRDAIDGIARPAAARKAFLAAAAEIADLAPAGALHRNAPASRRRQVRRRGHNEVTRNARCLGGGVSTSV